MALFQSPNIVTDQLLFSFDAANPKSYPGSGVAWNNLTDGFDATLTNGPTYTTGADGYISFDGTNDYAAITITGGSFSTAEATFITWIRRNGSNNSYTGLLFNRGGSPSTQPTGMNFYSDVHKLGYHWNDSSSTWTFSGGPFIPDQTWTMAAVSVSSSAANLYACNSNGIAVGTKTLSHSSASFSFLDIGRDQFGSSRHFKGDISIVQMYKKALTAAEIKQNFDAFKGRYGY